MFDLINTLLIFGPVDSETLRQTEAEGVVEDYEDELEEELNLIEEELSETQEMVAHLEERISELESILQKDAD